MFVLRGIIFDSIPSAELMAHQPWPATSDSQHAAGPVLTCEADMTNCDSAYIRATYFNVRTLPHVMRLLTAVSRRPPPAAARQTRRSRRSSSGLHNLANIVPFER
jgi:hypothetical protein